MAAAAIAATPREQLVKVLRRVLPRNRYQLYETDASVGKLAKPAAIVKQLAVEPEPSAPQGAWRVDFVVTIANDSEDSAQREVRLDDDVLAVMASLSGENSLTVGKATKVRFSDVYLAYDIAITLISVKE